ncbi:prepilin-type N-terminal cleavage/methylation domain-containing protein [bacterium]|nr:MAG: prepilin-type N-terminal cleavage/methylation domain-containing protein [bacterium]
MKPGLRIRQRGFTLIELLIVIAIIGIIASMLIPNLLDAMQKAKQKRTMADMRLVGSAMFAWLTDEAGAAAAGQQATTIDLADYGTAVTPDDVAAVLVPTYLQYVPVRDGWKNDFDYYLKTGDPFARQVMAIGSPARDTTYDSGPYTVSGFDPTDYDRDIIWADGFFVRWPQSQQ